VNTRAERTSPSVTVLAERGLPIETCAGDRWMDDAPLAIEKEQFSMAFIPRQAKPPARIPITCKVPEEVATLLKQYAEFMDSSQEHVVSEILRVVFRRDQEFQAWLTTRLAAGASKPLTTTPASPHQNEEKEPAGGSFRKGREPVSRD
jgi:hypothetical protein